MIKMIINLFFLLSLTYGQITNKVEVIVNDEPITKYDIDKIMNEKKVSKQEAIDSLIIDRLETFQEKQFGIFVNDLELNQEINNMLNNNKISLEQFKKILQSKNENFDDFKNQFRKDMRKKKLYDILLSGAKIDYSDNGAKDYFEQNKDKFMVYTNINVELYRAKDPKTLENFIKKRKFDMKNIKKENVALNTNNADPRLLSLLSRINIDEYSPILSSNNQYEVYMVKSKKDKTTPDFENVKNQVLNSYVSTQKQNYLKDFFEKLKSDAIVEYLE